jgi:glutathione S-transferase
LLFRGGACRREHWLHTANGSLQPAIMRIMIIKRVGVSPENHVLKAAEQRLDLLLGLLDARLGKATCAPCRRVIRI